jgi:hypothetical protein
VPQQLHAAIRVTREFGVGESLQSGACIYDIKNRTHLCWKVLSRAHGRKGKNRRPRGKGIFIISTARRHRPSRKAGECLKNNAVTRFRLLILGLRSMQVGAQSSSLLLAVIGERPWRCPSQFRPRDGQTGTIHHTVPVARSGQDSLGATLLSLHCGIQIRMVAGFAKLIEREVALVVGACNHPNW